MASKPSIPKGTRDFSPTEVAKRQYIIQIIKNNFEKHKKILLNFKIIVFLMKTSRHQNDAEVNKNGSKIMSRYYQSPQYINHYSELKISN